MHTLHMTGMTLAFRRSIPASMCERSQSGRDGGCEARLDGPVELPNDKSDEGRVAVVAVAAVETPEGDGDGQAVELRLRVAACLNRDRSMFILVLR